MSTRAELTGVIGDWYRASSRREKRRILDEFVAVSGYHRKHAIRLLRGKPDARSIRGTPHRVYGTEVRDALVVLWRGRTVSAQSG